MRCSKGTAAPGNVACGITAETCNKTLLLAIVSMASNFKGNSVKGFRRRDIMTSTFASFFCVGPADRVVPASRLSFAWKSAVPEVRHWDREIHSRINKFAQNLHVLKLAVEAEKEGLDPCFKPVRLFALHRPRGKVRYVGQCLNVLQ